MVWQSAKRFAVDVLSYCLTSNHTHFLVRAKDSELISQWMHQIEGEFAQWYNRRQKRSGAFWEGRYHSTMIEPGQHLWRCMAYIELNMVRAGVVSHPAQWPWCSYGEWMGQRQRYGVVNKKAGLELLGQAELTAFQQNYSHLIEETLAQEECRREPEWTESIAVGSRQFIGQIQETVEWRRRFEIQEVFSEAWALKEEGMAKSLEAKNSLRNWL